MTDAKQLLLQVQKRKYPVVTSVEQPKPNYVPVNHISIHGLCAEECAYIRVNKKDDNGFAYCVNPDIIKQFNWHSHNNLDIGLLCNSECPHYRNEKRKMIPWVSYKGLHLWADNINISTVESKFYIEGMGKPKGHQLVISRSRNGNWHLQYYNVVKLHGLIWLPYEKTLYRKLARLRLWK